MSIELTKELLESLRKLPRSKALAAMRMIGQSEWTKCSEDIHYWLDPRKHADIPYVYTLDNHPMHQCRLCAGTPSEHITHRFNKRGTHLEEVHSVIGKTEREIKAHFIELPMIRPFTVFDYMPPIIDAWLQEQFMVIEKSRDMMATWLCVMMHTWEVLFHNGRQVIFQSEDSGKSQELVRRAKFIYDNQPKWLREIAPASYSAAASRAGALNVPSLNSEILGFPQGPDQIRQYHPFAVFSDEMAFQVEAMEAFSAIKPAISAGGKFTAVSTANPGFFQMLCRDRTHELTV